MNSNQVKINGELYWKSGFAAAKLGVSKPTLLKYAADNAISYYLKGKEKVFKPEWLASFVEERTKVNVCRGRR